MSKTANPIAIASPPAAILAPAPALINPFATSNSASPLTPANATGNSSGLFNPFGGGFGLPANSTVSNAAPPALTPAASNSSYDLKHSSSMTKLFTTTSTAPAATAATNATTPTPLATAAPFTFPLTNPPALTGWWTAQSMSNAAPNSSTPPQPTLTATAITAGSHSRSSSNSSLGMAAGGVAQQLAALSLAAPANSFALGRMPSASSPNAVTSIAGSGSVATSGGSLSAVDVKGVPNYVVSPVQEKLRAEMADFVCSICANLVWRPVQTPCMHVFCHFCLVQYVRSHPPQQPAAAAAAPVAIASASGAAAAAVGSSSSGGVGLCPTDGARIDERDIVFLETANPFAYKILGRIEIYCPAHRSDGCEWRGEYSAAATHIESKCGWVALQCPHCLQRIKRQHFDAHTSSECRSRPVTCAHCHSSLPFHSLSTHDMTCDKKLIVCGAAGEGGAAVAAAIAAAAAAGGHAEAPHHFGCGLSLLRESYDWHVASECPKSLVPCLYESEGCTGRFARENLIKHAGAVHGEQLASSLQNERRQRLVLEREMADTRRRLLDVERELVLLTKARTAELVAEKQIMNFQEIQTMIVFLFEREQHRMRDELRRAEDSKRAADEKEVECINCRRKVKNNARHTPCKFHPGEYTYKGVRIRESTRAAVM